MTYGQTDDIIEARKDCSEAVQLLLGVAGETQTVTDVRAWLEKHYPELCIESVKKW